MEHIDFYVKSEAECRRLAELSRNKGERQRWLTLADYWHRGLEREKLPLTDGFSRQTTRRKWSGR